MLDIERLRITFTDGAAPFTAVKDFNLKMKRGEVVGVVGESGSGKSITAQAIMGLLRRSTVTVSGSVNFEGVELLQLSRSRLRELQGRELSMIFQEPMTSLNPTMKVGKQVEEALLIHTGMSPQERRARALEAMASVELPDPAALYGQYPHQLSGGMRQRVMIAAALVLEPALLIADEPTTALDVTIQAQILKLLSKINRERNTAILFISHDLGVVRKLCPRVLVMEKGRVVEEGPTNRVFHYPQADYTKVLIASRPTRNKRRGGTVDG